MLNNSHFHFLKKPSLFSCRQRISQVLQMCRIGEKPVTALHFGNCHLLKALTPQMGKAAFPTPLLTSPSPSPSQFFRSPALLCIYEFDTERNVTNFA